MFAAETASSAAGKTRHDNAVGDRSSTTTGLKYAKIEQAAAERALNACNALPDQFDYLSATAEGALGSNAVRQYRSDVQVAVTTISTGLTDWSRAIGDIVDADKVFLRDGSWNSQNDQIERLYQASDEAEGKTDILLESVHADRVQIDQMLSDKIQDIQTRRARI
jgi:hypothetical protein